MAVPNRQIKRRLDPKTAQELETHFLRVTSAVSAEEMWKEMLTANDRRRLGGSLENLFRRLGTVGIWMKIRNVSQPRAILDLAKGLGFLDDRKCQRLLRKIGEKQNTRDDAPFPHWNRNVVGTIEEKLLNPP